MSLWKLDINGNVTESDESDHDFITLIDYSPNFPTLVVDNWFAKDFAYENIKVAFVFSYSETYIRYLADKVTEDIGNIAHSYSRSFSIDEITEHIQKFAEFNREKFEILKGNFYQISVAQFLKDHRGERYSPKELNDEITMHMWNESIESLVEKTADRYPEIKIKNNVCWWDE